MNKKKALLVGIDDYAPSGVGGPDLRGCVNDTRDIASTLSNLGIVPAAPHGMRILTNARATKASILEGLQWLVADAKKDDVLIFYYSGHGSQVVDTGLDEPDHKDETICPHDFSSSGMIKDDDLKALFAPLDKGVNLDVILDSCHSGSMTRGLLSPPAPSNEGVLTIRYVEPPLDYGFFIDAAPSLQVQRLVRWEQQQGVTTTSRQPVVVPKLKHVLWAACKDNQTSTETIIDGSIRGVFTYYFCRALRTLGTSVTRLKLDSVVSTELKRKGFQQVPQLEGTAASQKEKIFT